MGFTKNSETGQGQITDSVARLIGKRQTSNTKLQNSDVLHVQAIEKTFHDCLSIGNTFPSAISYQIPLIQNPKSLLMGRMLYIKPSSG